MWYTYFSYFSSGNEEKMAFHSPEWDGELLLILPSFRNVMEVNMCYWNREGFFTIILFLYLFMYLFAPFLLICFHNAVEVKMCYWNRQVLL